MSGELFGEWCALQAPTLVAGEVPEHYACMSYGAFLVTEQGCFIGPQTDVPVDCGLLACGTVCTCDADNCAALQGDDVRLDAALQSEGEELEGSLDTPQGRFQVRMVRE